MRGIRGGEWTGEMTSGRIRTRVLHGHQARMWSGLLVAPQCPPKFYFFFLLLHFLCPPHPSQLTNYSLLGKPCIASLATIFGFIYPSSIILSIIYLPSR